MRRFVVVPLALFVALGARATTLSDNLTSPTFATELVQGTTWITAGFQTGSSSYTLQSATFLLQQDTPGALNVALYSSAPMQPPNNLGSQPGTMLGSITGIATYNPSLSLVVFSGNNLTLAAHTTYWMVMSASGGGAFEWAYETGATGSGVGFYPSWGISSDSGTSWFTDNLQPMQMSIIGTPVNTVPEPAAAWLLLLGAGLAVISSYRRNSGTLGFIDLNQRLTVRRP